MSVNNIGRQFHNESKRQEFKFVLPSNGSLKRNDSTNMGVNLGSVKQVERKSNQLIGGKIVDH